MRMKRDRILCTNLHIHTTKEKRKKRKLVHFMVCTPIIMCAESESAVRSVIGRLQHEISKPAPADPQFGLQRHARFENKVDIRAQDMICTLGTC
jgi:hypothetical protein